ncbi:MAG TPA: SDR family NAD(P)-dependent oxidoreductase, partial [Azospirillum sp.]
PVAAEAAADDAADAVGPDALRRRTAEGLKGLLARTVRMPVERISAFEPLEAYGLDSIAVTQLNQQLEMRFGAISKTLFYQYQTLDALAAHLAAEHPAACLAWAGQAAPARVAAPVAVSEPAVRQTALPDGVQEPIAIVGIAGRYPQADTLEAFWENLKAGRDCVREIPPDRWPVEGFYEADPKRAVETGRSYSKWGGFLDGFADFDPLFFNIAPKEALAIDPQERLVLQCVWHALEDAGCTRETLRTAFRQNVGVFVGITKTGFDLYGPELWRQGQAVFPHTSFGSVANRVSYFLNLRGPSMPIDTMCSSALTAIHEACQHIRHGDCEMAIAAAVNLYLHPSTYAGLCSANMLSRDGQCRSFGDGGNGFVPGEGVGAVVLKRLSQAERDGDRIHAVIRASAVNHGGKTNGYTVPNPVAQADLIRACLRRAGVDARSVGYVEAHGTGTALGDPIEVTGLTEAFRTDTADTGFCALGSVKSNVGHLEAAAGMAGLAKIILQMRHGQIVPSLHSRRLNPNIDFTATPFVVPQELAEWRRPVLDTDGTARELPRRAGLSSFGAGGANAHLLVEEYVPPAPAPRPASRLEGVEPAVILLSAKTGERLRHVVADLLAFIDRHGEEVALRDIAYTLQVGREAMDERLGLVVSSAAELRRALAGVLSGDAGGVPVRRGRVERDKDVLAAMAEDRQVRESVRDALARGDHDTLLAMWVRGLAIDWSALYGAPTPKRVGLPLYPFAPQRCWLEVPGASVATPPASATPAEAAAELFVMLPVWDAVVPGTGEAIPAPGARVAVVGGGEARRRAVRLHCADAVDLAVPASADAAGIAALLRAAGRLDHLVWFAPEGGHDVADDGLIDAQRDGVLALFRLVKALLAEGYGTAAFGITIVTTQALAVPGHGRVDPTHAAVHGLAGSLAREFPAWTVRALDVAADAPWPVPGLWRLPGDGQAGSYAWRGREWLRQTLVRLAETPAGDRDPYRRGGVYVVIGGAGGLGETWSRAMIRDHGARIVWLGRSAPNAEIRAKIDALAQHGPAPEYIQADARDAGAMRRACLQIRQIHGAIHGLVVSTLGDYDQSLAQMPEALFRDILSTKLDVGVRAAQAFRDEALDFVVFFSSMVAFGRPGGMAAYAAACAFADAFARRLAQDWTCPVKVVNWGYWDVGGGTRISGALKTLVEHRGVQPIEAGQGLAALKALLGSPLPQVAVTRTSRPELIETFAADQQAMIHPASRSVAQALAAYRPAQAAPAHNPETDELNRWLVRLLFVELRSLGLFGEAERLDADALRRRAGILDKFDRWWRECLNVLAEHGYLRLDGGYPVPVAEAAPGPRDRVWQDWQHRKPAFLAQPETRTLAVLVEDCMARLPDVLRGTTLVTDILFPNGSMDKIAGLYRDNRVCDHFNDVVAGVVETFIARRVAEDPDARIRIIEIGAGTGGTTTTVLPRLDPWRRHVAEYRYTDLSKSFFIHARQRYGDKYPYLDYAIFNVEEPPEGQGIAAGAYDIAIATNVLHATRSMRNTLRNAKAVLRGGGILVANEISDKTVFASLLFGLIDGWSLAEDEHWRIPGSPGLYPESWRDLMLQEGYSPVLFPAEAAHALGQQIVVGLSDGVVLRRAAGAEPARTPDPVPAPAPEAAPPAEDMGEAVRAVVLDALAQSLGIDHDAVETDVAFSDYGVDSILGVGFVQRVNTGLGLSLNTTVLFDHTTAERLTRHIVAEHRPVPAQS